MDNNKEDYFIFLGVTFYIKDNVEDIINKIINFGFTEIPFCNTYHGLNGDEQKKNDYLFYIDRT